MSILGGNTYHSCLSALVVAVAILAGGLCCGQEPIHVAVNLVNVAFSVQVAGGALLDNLTKEDVEVYEDAVGLEHLAVHVAEEGKFNTDLFGERGVGGGTIQTNSENFRIRGVNLTGGDSSLDRLKLLRSTAGEGQDVGGEKDVLLAAIVAELHGFPLVAK